MSEDDDIVDVSAADALVVRRPHCAHCGMTASDIMERRRAKDPLIKTDAAVLVEMQPGPDGRPWHLCVPCWVPGKVERPVGEQSPPQPTQPKAVKVIRPRAPRKPKATAQH